MTTATEKGYLPTTPYFVHITHDGWDRWNYLVRDYAVVGRVEPSNQPEHKGEFWFTTGHGFDRHDGYKPTLQEAQREVADYVLEHYEIKRPTQTYNGA
jgi:hypothetical protein